MPTADSPSVDAATSLTVMGLAARLEYEEWFAAVVRRHAGWMYGAALRRVRERQSAEDAVQTVFVLLHRKSPRFHSEGQLVSWLHQTTQNVAREIVRCQARCNRHENTLATQPGHSQEKAVMDASMVAEWNELAPMLDDLVARLSDRDRQAILLRFYRQQDWNDVAISLGLSADAARKRVERAVERLRTLAQKHGRGTLTAGTLVALLSNGLTADAAPAGLVGVATSAALSPLDSGVQHAIGPLVRAVRRRALEVQATQALGVLLTIGLLVGGAVLLALHYWRGNPSPGADAAPAALAVLQAPPRDAGKPRVGILISKTNAETIIDVGPVGYDRMTRIISEVRDDRFELVAIVDAGTADDPAVREACAKTLPGASLVDGSDAEQVAALDVIIASHITRMPASSLDSVDRAVRGGTGLYVRMFIGPGNLGADDRRVAHLNALLAGDELTADQAKNPPAEPLVGPWYSRSGRMACVAAGSHDLLGNLAGTKKEFSAAANGVFGRCLGTALVIAVDNKDVPVAPNETLPIALLRTARYERGSIVVAAFSGSRPLPTELDRADAVPFGVRAVEWLVNEKRLSKDREPEPMPPIVEPAPTTQLVTEPK
ncbi:MAG: sigma-70 family RNA polymerase sigma factor [Tepidisphaeraceae bacterium]